MTIRRFAWPAAFAIALTAFAWWWLPVAGVAVNDNAAMYLQQGAAIARGEDPGLTFEGRAARGPLFPAAVAAAFKLAGRGVEPAMYVARLGLIGAIAAAAMLAFALAGAGAAFGAAVLVATMFGLSYAAGSLDTDVMLPAIVLAFLAAYERAVDRDRVWIAALAGVLLGAAFLVKESAVVFVAVPLLGVLLAADPHRANRWRRLVAVYAAALAVVGPWALGVVARYGPDALLGVMHPGVQARYATMEGFDRASTHWLHLLTIGMPGSLLNYVDAQLSKATPLAWVFAACWVIVAIAAVRDVRARRLLIAGAVFVPVLVADGATPGRIGQTTIFMALSAVALAVLLTWAFVRRAPRVSHAVTACVCAALAAVQLIVPASAGASTLDLWREGRDAVAPLRRLAGGEFRVSGRFTAEQANAAVW
ncbi:MAG: glycosyltransferase family 39 protein, partial [Acidobacteriota bacterium]|nr:glycosyltransferase family 39 protein [Acidobacteriota bacterium]